jgi:hypothetical protein
VFQFGSADLRGTAIWVGRALKITETGVVEFRYATIGRVLGAADLPRSSQDTQAVANQPDQLVALRHPAWQLAVMHFGAQLSFFAAMEAAQG